VKQFVLKTCFRTGIILLLMISNIQCSGSPENKAEENGEETEIEEDLSAFIPQAGEELPVTSFGEIWGYVVAGYESGFKRGIPISDIGYFGAEIDAYGALTGVPKKQNLPAFSGRVHMVVACNGRALTHFVLAPNSQERRALIAALLAEARNFDGLQIDFENVPPRDGEAFLSFIRELRAGLGDKIFTIALAAKTRKLANDVYDYETIKPHVDKILVMAYDEHWSGSSPGSVASIQWCRNVANYSLRAIGPEKLIMGLPFYGRAWGSIPTSRALTFSTTDTLLNTMNITARTRENGIPTFDYNVTVPVKVYYEDEYSISARTEMYKSMNVRAIGFWRLGQETPKVWNILKLER
jgi:spore germination protein YaaH